jgi:glycerophosphoryl diester phosphodiesterase
MSIAFRQISPELGDRATLISSWRKSGRTVLEEASRGGLAYISPHFSTLLRSPGLVGQAKRRGLRVTTWTVNHATLARLLGRLGVEIIISDDPVSLHSAIAAR